MRRVCYLVTLVLQLVDGGQGAAGGFEVHEAVPLAPICSLVQDSLGGTYRTKPSKQLIVTPEPAVEIELDVEIEPQQAQFPHHLLFL